MRKVTCNLILLVFFALLMGNHDCEVSTVSKTDAGKVTTSPVTGGSLSSTDSPTTKKTTHGSTDASHIISENIEVTASTATEGSLSSTGSLTTKKTSHESTNLPHIISASTTLEQDVIDTTTVPRPMDPKCPNIEQRVLDYTANEITLNLTGITTDNKTTDYCIHFKPMSTSDENSTCVQTNLFKTEIENLQPGTLYTFSIFASIETEGGRIQSMKGCPNITHFTRPMDPKCPNTEQKVLDFTANEITLNLTGITTDNKTTDYCIHIKPMSTSDENSTCVPTNLSNTAIENLRPGTLYTFSIFASIEPEGGRIQSSKGCANITHFTRPMDPKCPNTEQRVLDYTANEITLNLTGITTDNKTTEYCIHFKPPSTSDQNRTCVSKMFQTKTVNNLQPGTSYTFAIYASIQEGSRIQSSRGCANITQFTSPLMDCLSIESVDASSIFFHNNQMKRYNISINSTSFIIFNHKKGGLYDISSKLDSGMNYTLSITGEGGGEQWTQETCQLNISTGISQPHCDDKFYDVFDNSVNIYPRYCNATGVHVFSFSVDGKTVQNVLPTKDVVPFKTKPGQEIPIVVYAFGRNGVPSESLRKFAYTKPNRPICKNADYKSTNNVINIKGSSFSAEGAAYFIVERLKLPSTISVVHKTNMTTFEDLQAGQPYTFVVKAQSQHGELSFENCSFVAYTRPNNPVCDRVSFPDVKTNSITLDLVSLNASGANSYLVTYNSSTIQKNITFGNHNLRQEIKNLIPGTNYHIKIFSIGSGGFFSSLSCKLEKYTHPPAFENATFEEDVSYIRIRWNHEEGNVERYIIDVNCSCEIGSCTQCVPNFKNLIKESEANITDLNPGSRCNISLVAVSGPFQSATLILRLKTKELAPGKVSGLNVTAVTTDSITLDWKEPDCPNGDITMYTLSITTAEDKTGNTTHTNEYSYRFTKLKPGTFYNISVLAINSVYKGEVSVLHVYTVETVPSKVRNLLAKNTSSTSIKIDWIIPNPPNGVVNEYKVFIITNSTCVHSIQLTCQKCDKMYQDDAAYLKEEANNNQGDMFELAKSCIIPVEGSFESSNISVSVDNLTFFTEYQVFVYAHTSKGYGPNSNVTVVTSEDRPSRPTHLRGNASQHIIYLEFQTPKPPNGHLILLQIEYTYKTQNICLSKALEFETKREKRTIHGPVTDVFTTKLENVFSYWDYTIRVQMATYVGFGYYSEEVTIRTKPDVPDIVRKIEKGTVSSRSIKLLWEGPCQPNGIIEHFLITIYDVTYLKNHSMTTPSNTTSYNVTGLFPYRKYVFGISAKTEGVETPGQKVESRAINTSTEAAYKPRDLSFHTTSVSVLLNWKPPSLQTGPTHYMAVATDLRTGKTISNCLSTGFSNTSCAIKDLHPFWNYSVTLSAKTEPFDANSTSILIRTNESAPGKVADFKVTQVQNLTILREVILKWKQPLLMDRNGIIQKYFIRYWVADSNVQNTVTTESYGNETFSANIKDVKPEKEYTFQIFPATIANASEEHYVTRNITIRAGAPIPIEIPKSEEYISLGTSSKISDDEKQLSVSLNYRSLCNNANGNPVSWFIIVAGESNVPKSLSLPFQDSREKYDLFIKKEYKTWSSVHTQDQFDPYIARSDWDPECSKHRRQKRALEEKTVSFLVGEEGKCDGITGYCNGYLKPGRKYRVRFTVCTREGCLESEFSSPLETKPNLVPAIAGSITGVVVALVVLIVVVTLYLKRKGKGPFKAKSSEIERGNDNETFSTELETKKMPKPRPVKTAEFAGHVQRMHADSNLLFSNEYKLLKETCPTHTTKAAEVQVNRIKNRYTNILSYDHSRVKLLPTEDDEGSDYINANYIPGYSSQREYIATQGPLPFTRDDFWRMMWEQNVSIIVMLTQLVERGRRKCDIYWPEATREPVYYGDLVVEIESESTLPDYVLRVMSVKLGSRTRKIKQLHYLKWPDMGCPETTWLLLNFVGATRLYLPHNDPGPIVVHCSAGVGRTGTFIAVDFLMQHVSSSDVIDIYDYVMKMRNNRPNMVQTEDQYVFIHDCIRDFINRSDEDSDDENGEGQEDQENPIYANM